MTVRNITKSLAGVEDLLLGTGTEIQDRGAVSAQTINKIDLFQPVATLAALKALDTTKYTKAIVMAESGNSGIQYYFDSTSTATADDYFAILPNAGAGRWLLAFEAERTFDTFANLVASKQVVVGQTVVARDRANAKYIVVAPATGAGDGSDGTWNLTGISGQIQLVTTGRILNVQWFGAAGNAVGNGSGSTDEGTEINNAITTAQALFAADNKEGFGVFFPSGVYQTKKTIVSDSHVYLVGENKDVKLITASTGTVLTDIGGGIKPVVHFPNTVAFGSFIGFKVFDFSQTSTDVIYYANQIDGEGYKFEDMNILGGSNSCISYEGATYFNVKNIQGGQSGGYYFHARNQTSDHYLSVEKANIDACKLGFVKLGSNTSKGGTVSLKDIRSEFALTTTLGTIVNTADSSGDTSVNVVGHGYLVNQQIVVRGTTNLAADTYRVKSVTDVDNFVLDVAWPGTADTAGSTSVGHDIITVDTSAAADQGQPIVIIHGLHLSTAGASNDKLGYASILRTEDNFSPYALIEGVHWGDTGAPDFAQPKYLRNVVGNTAKDIIFSTTFHWNNAIYLNDNMAHSFGEMSELTVNGLTTLVGNLNQSGGDITATVSSLAGVVLKRNGAFQIVHESLQDSTLELLTKNTSGDHTSYLSDAGGNTKVTNKRGNPVILNKLGVENSAAATTLGSVTKKVEVFDATGASLGFVPVYDSIT